MCWFSLVFRLSNFCFWKFCHIKISFLGGNFVSLYSLNRRSRWGCFIVTEKWSLIQGRENVFPDLTYFVIIDLLEVEIYCKWAERVINARISQPPFLRLPSYHHNFQMLWAKNLGLVPNSRSWKCLPRPYLLSHYWLIRSRNIFQIIKKAQKWQNLITTICKIAFVPPPFPDALS